MINVKFTNEEPNALKDYSKQFEIKFKAGAIEGTRDMAKSLTIFSKNNHPTFKDRTGNLSSSYSVQNTKDGAVINNSAQYSNYLYFGTKPHMIKAKPGGFLKFTQNGRTVFAKEVNVSGIKKGMWIENNYIANQNSFNQIIINGIDKGVQ